MNWFFVEYWTWWFSASMFATLVVGIWVIERRMLGVSGSFSRAVTPESATEKAFQELERKNPQAIEDAMLRATLEEFGPEAVEAFLKEMAEDDDVVDSAAKPSETLARSSHLMFLAMLVVGGAVGSLGAGTWSIRSTLGSLHTALMHGEAMSLVALVVGGVFVGFGTRMAGGCTSGHGLSGCSRVQPGSLVATASFFGTAIGVSYLLRAFL